MPNNEKNNLKSVFSLTEESLIKKRDEHGRFAAKFSERKYIDRPIVSEQLVKKGVIKPSYPEKKEFAVCITHDIDEIFLPIKNSIKQFAKNTLSLNINSAFLNIRSIVNKKDNPFYNIHKLISIEKEFDANATYFFLALKNHEKDFNYNLEEVQDIIQDIIKSGSEIGLHGGHDAFLSHKKIIQEKEYLERVSGIKVIGYRNHYLKIKIPDTWENLIKAGIKYDSTLGFYDKVGFRNGMCHPFYPYDEKKERHLNIMEIPLSVMDCSLNNYMGLNIEESFNEVKEIIDRVHSINGVFTLLWHNTYFFDEQLELYRRILDYCQNKNAWFTSCGDIYKWCAKEYNNLNIYNKL